MIILKARIPIKSLLTESRLLYAVEKRCKITCPNEIPIRAEGTISILCVNSAYPTSSMLNLANIWNVSALKTTVFRRFDPNAKKIFTYKGYFLKDLIRFFFKGEKFGYLETKAVDGYKVNLINEDIEIGENFLALEIM